MRGRDFDRVADVINKVFNTRAYVRIGEITKKCYFCEIIGRK